MRVVPLTGRGDRARLLAIATQDMSDGYQATLARELDDVAAGAARGVGALEGATPIGYAVFRKTVGTHHLDTIAVDRASRGAGVGTALLDAVGAALREDGTPALLNVVTDAAATETVPFYTRRGFTVARYVTDEFLPGVTQAHLTLEVRPCSS